jgi:hypothetical protein
VDVLTVRITGKFVNPILRNPDAFNGKQVLMATDYYPVDQITSEFEEVTGKKAHFVQVTADQYKSFLPAPVAQEMLENHLFVEEPGYFNGMSLAESLNNLEVKPTTWKEFVAKTFL